MKKSILFAALTATLTLASCSSEDPVQPAQDGQVAAQIIAGVGGPKSRANGNLWEADRIGVTVTAAPESDMATRYANVLYTTTSTSEVAAFESTTPIYFQDANETVTFSAYAPYSSSSSMIGSVIEFYTDNQSTRESQKNIDFIFAKGATATRDNPTVSFSGEHKFTHRMARVVITVKPGKDMTIDDIKSADCSVGQIYTLGVFDSLTGHLTMSPDTPFGPFALSNSIRNDYADRISYTALIIPHGLNEPHTFSVEIAGQVYKNTSAIAPWLEAGKSYSYTFTVNKTGIELEASEVSDWEDLPNVDGDATM